ncbi:hypothetical protein CONCODRAFT_10011 [Conidiobolus coronatus NRRL 28638]|uniref:FAD-binding FR-type domain-containing protein n=1 Tax=Conidiobolus coronatus (strain ATCC 28846 / CBS 209.66 / NRRL 28638) TaxID=796925 RepID=A0A137NY89_CONC2|nr:hypothetical protein CONCODRAFT_10011 [Conidiobolus coronatus NRRL 28638]|eukprot:KXN67830.1 hypothetical protein CONCODRAFT_10011 [Conidiobolus coronatus NRRL 28638]
MLRIILVYSSPIHPPHIVGGGSFWKYWVLSGVLYLIERIIRKVRGFQDTTVSKVVLHPSKVVGIQIKKEGIKTQVGQYIFLNCPEVSLHQSHPFTLTSTRRILYSVHVRVVGNFTTSLARNWGMTLNIKMATISLSIICFPALWYIILWVFSLMNCFCSFHVQWGKYGV